MNDRELLEMAAKAAGIEHVNYDGVDYDGGAGLVIVGEHGQHLHGWNPLKDDGDALRLAVKLQLTICNEHISAGSAYCIASGFGIDSDAPSFPEVDSGENESEVIPDDYAATRRAIVLAAAQIGAAMP